MIKWIRNWLLWRRIRSLIRSCGVDPMEVIHTRRGDIVEFCFTTRDHPATISQVKCERWLLPLAVSVAVQGRLASLLSGPVCKDLPRAELAFYRETTLAEMERALQS